MVSYSYYWCSSFQVPVAIGLPAPDERQHRRGPAPAMPAKGVAAALREEAPSGSISYSSARGRAPSSRPARPPTISAAAETRICRRGLSDISRDKPLEARSIPRQRAHILIHQREGALQAHDSHGAAGQSARLLFGGMGRMVGGDHLNRTVRDARDQRGAVFAAAQRRIHLEASVLLQILVAEQQIMRRRFAAHTHAARPSHARTSSTLSLVETWQT